MSKRYIKESLERDAYLSRHNSQETTLQNLQKTVERLSKLMPMSQADKDELLEYAKRLSEHQSVRQDSRRGKRDEVLAEPATNTSSQDRF